MVNLNSVCGFVRARGLCGFWGYFSFDLAFVLSLFVCLFLLFFSFFFVVSFSTINKVVAGEKL